MKKKIYGLLVCFMAIISLAGCAISFGEDKYTAATDAEYIYIQNTVSDVVKMVDNACVGIYSANYSTKLGGSGSGVVIKKDGLKYYVVTNYHVVEDMTSFEVYLSESFSITAKLEATLPSHDLACLSFEAADRYNVGVINIDKTLPIPNVGQTVIAIGCPLGLDNYNYTTVGVVTMPLTKTYVDSPSDQIDVVMHDAAINPGNSGGGLFDLQGNLLGLNFRKLMTDNEGDMVEGYGETIYVKEVLDFLKDNSIL